MKTTYDILLNFKKIPYEFYEWKPSDEVEHIKIMPVIKISDEDFISIYNNIIKIDNEFLTKIKNKTEIFSNGLIKIISYACIFCNDESAIAVEFDKDGIISGKSKLLLDEEDEAVMLVIQSDIVKLKYQIIASLNNISRYTRKEQKQLVILNKYLNMIKDDDEKIKYIYLECFNYEEQDFQRAFEKIVKEVNSININVINKLYNLIKVLKK